MTPIVLAWMCRRSFPLPNLNLSGKDGVQTRWLDLCSLADRNSWLIGVGLETRRILMVACKTTNAISATIKWLKELHWMGWWIWDKIVTVASLSEANLPIALKEVVKIFIHAWPLRKISSSKPHSADASAKCSSQWRSNLGPSLEERGWVNLAANLGLP